MSQYTKHSLTVVTGLWNMGRDALSNGFERTFDHYLDHLKKLMEVDAAFYIYTERSLVPTINSIRSANNTVIKLRELEEMDDWFCFFKEVQEIRERPEWRTRAGWLESSPQACLKYYNPVVLAKMFMLNDAALSNPFASDYFIWLDAGITNTVHSGYFTHDKILNNLPQYLDKFLFLSFPYEDSQEIHGFDRKIANELAGVRNLKYVCRGGLFGGSKEQVHVQNGLYYEMTKKSLELGEMGTEETIFAMLAHKFPNLYHRYMLQAHGMISNFCEAVKNDEVVFEDESQQVKKQEERTLAEFHEAAISNPKELLETSAEFFTKEEQSLNTSLYFLAFNFPDQLKMTLNSLSYQYEFSSSTMKYCIDNSTSLEAIEEHKSLCHKYHIQHIPMHKNLGICGGRQWIAEHFDQSNADYYIFFEDDMMLCERDSYPCRFGFMRWTHHLLPKCIHILNEEKLDFLKLTFSEFFGTHTKQWAWHNVPQVKREEYWPEIPEVKDGLHGPYTQFHQIKSHQGLPYALGEIYYSNWPTLFNKEGNRKMFLNTTWAHPFEQTWMSYAFTELKEGRLKAGVLLASMIDHNRLYHYSASDRREN